MFGRARVRHFRRFPDNFPTSPAVRHLPPTPYSAYVCALCAYIYLCAGNIILGDARNSAEEIHSACRGGSYANNLYILFFITIVLSLSLISVVVRSICICYFYGSFCSITPSAAFASGFCYH